MTETAPTPAPTEAPERSLDQWGPAHLIGLLLLLPALAMLVASYVVPTISTIRTGLDGDHYGRLLDDGYADTFRFAATVMIWPIVTVTLVAIVIAYLTNRAGRMARWVIRLALVLPMVALSPTAFAVAWRLDRVDAGEPATDAAAQSLVRGAVGLTMFGLLVGVGVTLYLATLKTRERTRPHAATLVVALLAVLAVLAVGLQLYTYPTVLSGAGGSADTPLTTVFTLAFRQAEPGPAAAAASLLLAALAALGVLAVLLAIVTGLRIEVPPLRRDEADTQEAPGRPRSAHAAHFQGTKAAARHSEAVFGSLLAVLAVIAIAGYGLWPWLSRLLQFRAQDTGQVLLNTWLPPLIGAVVGMVAAALAGFAIGALRPLGRFSSLLLLLFAPWLFVGNGVLMGYEFDRYSEVGGVLSLVPPGWVVVPAVVVFTLLFRGQQVRWRQLRADGLSLGAATRRALILPALPLFWLVGAATWLVQSQSLIWNQVSAGGDRDQASGPAALFEQLQSGPSADFSELAVGLVLPFVVILAFGAGLALLQVTYLDRLTIKVGRNSQTG